MLGIRISHLYARVRGVELTVSMIKMIGMRNCFAVACLALICGSAVTHASQECERLQASLTYTQEQAPRDLSGLLPVVVERVNRVLEGVVDVEVEWTGADFHGRVGEHIVQCKVTRLASAISPEMLGSQQVFTDDGGREVTRQCFHVPFSILDTNECTLPRGHRMRHLCHESSLCVNTVGSYECLCPASSGESAPPGTADDSFWQNLDAQDRGLWEVSFQLASRTSCPSMASTHGRCPERVHTKEGSECRASFRCPVDPCASESTNNCAHSAHCVRKESPLDSPNYMCQCPTGLMGNGLKCRKGIDPNPDPKVMYDGVTPTELTVKNDYYCDCTTPVVDACSGFPPCHAKHEVCTVMAGNVPKCACKPGFMMHEKYGCVDERPPLLRLKNDPIGDQILRLKQGDVYKEYAVDIQDENAEEYLRSLKIAYSQPLPHGCLTKIGEFHVNYTVATPWTSPPYVRVTRRVIIEDIDECSLDVATYEKTCPELVPQCNLEAGATCVNTIGSYTCSCPKFTSGDGFKSDFFFRAMDAPDGYQGGTGCHDTSKPIISLAGPDPKVFRICECGGLSGLMGKPGSRDTDLKGAQQRYYDDDIRTMIKSTAGAELCASHGNPSPKAYDCVKAFDQTYKGAVDLSREVTVGEPEQKSPLHWVVPYNVKDKAGNEAVTVWRNVVVEEVNLNNLESKILIDAQKDQAAAIQRAVDKALKEDRAKREKVESGNSRGRKATAAATQTCSECPKCDCSSDPQFDKSFCDAVCDAKAQTCARRDESVIVNAMLWLEDFFPPTLVPIILLCVIVTGCFLILRWTLTLIFNPQSYQRNQYAVDDRGRGLQDSVTYYPTHPHAPRINGASPPPRASLSSRGADTFMTPPQSAAPFASPPTNGNGSAHRPRENDLVDSIYASQPVITPSKRGDGVRQRSPYNLRDH